MWDEGNKEGTSKTFTKELTFRKEDGTICIRSTFTEMIMYRLMMRIEDKDLNPQ